MATEPGWVRRGECNHCGYCCMFLGSLLFKFHPTGKGGGEPDWHFLAVRGIETAGELAVKRVDLFAPCQVYDQTTRHEPGCKIYDVRPQTCRDYPERPEQVVGTPCSFYFERTFEDHIERTGGEGSAYPGRTSANL